MLFCVTCAGAAKLPRAYTASVWYCSWSQWRLGMYESLVLLKLLLSCSAGGIPPIVRRGRFPPELFLARCFVRAMPQHQSLPLYRYAVVSTGSSLPVHACVTSTPAPGVPHIMRLLQPAARKNACPHNSTASTACNSTCEASPKALRLQLASRRSMQLGFNAGQYIVVRRPVTVALPQTPSWSAHRKFLGGKRRTCCCSGPNESAHCCCSHLLAH